MTDGEFKKSQDEAVRRMMEMNSRSYEKREQGKIPPSPDFVRLRNSYDYNKPPLRQNEKTQTENKPFFENNNNREKVSAPANNGLNLPLLDSILKDGDSTLIIGLLLLLMSEKSDKILLFALVYILL